MCHSAPPSPSPTGPPAGRRRRRPPGPHPTRAPPTSREIARRASWDHPAFEHLVRDGGRDPVDELEAHLRIAAQKLCDFLFPRRLRLAPLFPELLAGRLPVLLNAKIGRDVQLRV